MGRVWGMGIPRVGVAPEESALWHPPTVPKEGLGPCVRQSPRGWGGESGIPRRQTSGRGGRLSPGRTLHLRDTPDTWGQPRGGGEELLNLWGGGCAFLPAPLPRAQGTGWKGSSPGLSSCNRLAGKEATFLPPPKKNNLLPPLQDQTSSLGYCCAPPPAPQQRSAPAALTPPGARPRRSPFWSSPSLTCSSPAPSRPHRFLPACLRPLPPRAGRRLLRPTEGRFTCAGLWLPLLGTGGCWTGAWMDGWLRPPLPSLASPRSGRVPLPLPGPRRCLRCSNAMRLLSRMELYQTCLDPDGRQGGGRAGGEGGASRGGREGVAARRRRRRREGEAGWEKFKWLQSETMSGR